MNWMHRWRARLIIAGLATSIVPAAAQKCPDVDPASGYPVAATVQGGATADSAWLARVAAAAAYRWRVPSRRRNIYAGWDRVRTRLLPPEPRWADDWTPDAKQHAVVRLTLRGGGRAGGQVATPSGDRSFDESLASIWGEPMPGAPALPDPPVGVTGDSIAVELFIGEVPQGTAAVIRFAAVQTRIELIPGSLRVNTPPGMAGRVPRVTVKYDVMTDGSVDLASIEFPGPVPLPFADAIREGLRDARFRPATQNCRPIAQSVVQTFGG